MDTIMFILASLASSLLLTAAVCDRDGEPVAPTSQAPAISAPTPEPLIIVAPGDSPTLTVSGAEFDLELAYTPDQRQQGLSDREALDAASGMLFIFERPGHHTFWMYNMNFPLDFVWIGADCAVADIHENVPHPAPDAEPSELPLYTPDFPALYNLEINGGQTSALGIQVGDKVKFDGFSGRGAICQ